MNAGKIRLCIVSPAESGGGAEYQTRLLIDALRRSGRTDIYYLARHLDDTARRDGYRAVRIGRSGRAPKLGYLTDVVPLYTALRRIAPQVIYQRVAGGYTGICALYARRHGARLIWHAASDADLTHESLDGGRNFVRRRLEKWSGALGIRLAGCVVVQHPRQTELLWRNFGRRADELVREFQPEASEQIDKSGTPTVVWIANLKPLKRPELFVRLAGALRDLKGVEFVMIGAQPPHPQPWSVALMQAIAQTPNLRFLGQRSHDEVHALLARACVCVNTSTHEGFPNTFIEAWLRDAVVVSLDVDPDGVLEREGAGIHAGSEERLQSAVRALLLDPAARAGYIERARRYVRAKHSLRNAELLVRLIEGGSPGAQPAFSADVG
ncbi:MAG TPA: glycosyltransferase [Steroidobacteraceae bacterium]|nr:glycosyltransferase [Steroidobacteraceae bacterium]